MSSITCVTFIDCPTATAKQMKAIRQVINFSGEIGVLPTAIKKTILFIDGCLKAGCVVIDGVELLFTWCENVVKSTMTTTMTQPTVKKLKFGSDWYFLNIYPTKKEVYNV